MKKLVLLTLEYPPDIGGVAEYLYGLWNALPPSVADGVVQVRLTPRRFVWLTALPAIWSEVKAHKPRGLVISHVLPMGYVALLMGLPYIVIAHGTDLKLAKATGWKKFWATIILRRAKLIIANSAYTAGLAKGFGIADKKIQIVHPCVLPHEPFQTPDARPQPSNLLLSVCRLVKRKGIDRVLDSIPALLKKFPDTRYIIVGSGPEEGSLMARAKELGIEAAVTFAGSVDMEERDRLYDKASVFVLPGTDEPRDIEGFGIAFLEAAMHGIPAVAGRHGGSPEAVLDGKTGLLVDGGDAEALESAIESLLAKPEIAKSLGEAGRARVLADFVWEKQATKLFERLKTL